MLQTSVIGRLGHDAEQKSVDGRDFVTFRVAHSESYIDSKGVKHESTQWVDCILDGKPKVLPYLKSGQIVMCQGATRLRCYSSAVDKCFKAGLTIQVRTLELVGSTPEPVPTKLYDPKTGEEYTIRKDYVCTELVRTSNEPEHITLVSKSGRTFQVDHNGNVVPFDTF